MTREDGWDIAVVQHTAGYWWWNAWRAQTATELTGTAGTLGEARVAMERAIAATSGAPDQLVDRRERRTSGAA